MTAKKATKKTLTKKTPAKKASKGKVKAKVKATGKVPAKKAKKATTQKADLKEDSAAGKVAASVRAMKKKKDEEPSNGTSSSAKKPVLGRPSVVRSGADGDRKATPVVFSLDDVEAIVSARGKEAKAARVEDPSNQAAENSKKKASITDISDKPAQKRVLGAASLADILGFNPSEKKRPTELDDETIPKKWKKFYQLLIQLRHHVRDELDLHTADTLKHSSREDSGDLANYSNHQADAGTDAFDRDFALSLVSNEQEALNEIEDAIQRIKKGTYGTCQVTGESISKERLEAVPFARYSVEGQAEYEKNKRRRIERGSTSMFSDSGDAPKILSDEDDDDA